MTKKFQFDADAVRQLAHILSDTGLTEIEYENEGCRIYVSRNQQVVSQIAAPLPSPVSASLPLPESPVPAEKSSDSLKSPMVGTIYLSAEPGSAPFINVGDFVTEGQTLLIIEAMKVMNPIKASKSGKVTHIFVKDATPIGYGEPLLTIA